MEVLAAPRTPIPAAAAAKPDSLYSLSRIKSCFTMKNWACSECVVVKWCMNNNKCRFVSFYPNKLNGIHVYACWAYRIVLLQLLYLLVTIGHHYGWEMRWFKREGFCKSANMQVNGWTKIKETLKPEWEGIFVDLSIRTNTDVDTRTWTASTIIFSLYSTQTRSHPYI